MKTVLLLICLFVAFLLAGKEKDIVAYSKNCAVTPEGALLEDVWQVIPDEEFLQTEEGKKPSRKTVIKVVYEREYLCFGLKMVTGRPAMSEAVKNSRVDSVSVKLFSLSGAKTAEFFVTPLWVESSWKQNKIHRSGVKRGGDYYSAEVRIPLFAEEEFFEKGQKYQLEVVRKSLSSSGKWETAFFRGSLLTGNLAYTDNAPRTNKKVWRNGEMNTFFKRPNIRWNSNWDLGEGDYLQQGWNLNKAKGRGNFEVFAHEDKADDYYVVLRNGDFYQMYKGTEKKMSYTFQAKGKGVLKVRFLRFSFRNQALRFLGVRSEREIRLDSDKWQTYTGTVEKSTGTEYLALDFSTENSEIMLDEAYMRGIK